VPCARLSWPSRQLLSACKYRTRYYIVSRNPKGKDNFWGLSLPLKSIVSHCCGVRSKKINNVISATAAADRIAPDCPVSHWLFPCEKSPPPAMRPLFNIFVHLLFSCCVWCCCWADAESVRGSHHGQLRLLDSRFVDPRSSPPRRVHSCLGRVWSRSHVSVCPAYTRFCCWYLRWLRLAESVM